MTHVSTQAAVAILCSYALTIFETVQDLTLFKTVQGFLEAMNTGRKPGCLTDCFLRMKWL